jgi:pyridoxamine 5'-phosphate oxidase family protein
MNTTTFSRAELAYLASQRLGRLATIDASGAPQNNPVGYVVEADGTIVIGGYRLATTRKFRNVQANEHVAFVVDDIVSVDPWRVRGVEVRGRAEAVSDQDPPRRGLSREQIRIRPDRVISWGLDDVATSEAG